MVAYTVHAFDSCITGPLGADVCSGALFGIPVNPQANPFGKLVASALLYYMILQTNAYESLKLHRRTSLLVVKQCTVPEGYHCRGFFGVSRDQTVS